MLHDYRPHPINLDKLFLSSKFGFLHLYSYLPIQQDGPTSSMIIFNNIFFLKQSQSRFETIDAFLALVMPNTSKINLFNGSHFKKWQECTFLVVHVVNQDIYFDILTNQNLMKPLVIILIVNREQTISLCNIEYPIKRIV